MFPPYTLYTQVDLHLGIMVYVLTLINRLVDMYYAGEEWDTLQWLYYCIWLERWPEQPNVWFCHTKGYLLVGFRNSYFLWKCLPRLLIARESWWTFFEAVGSISDPYSIFWKWISLVVWTWRVANGYFVGKNKYNDHIIQINKLDY